MLALPNNQKKSSKITINIIESKRENRAKERDNKTKYKLAEKFKYISNEKLPK